MNKKDTSSGISWNSHALLTMGALCPERFPVLNRQVPVAILEEFLEAASDAIPGLVGWHGNILQKKVGHSFNGKELAKTIATAGDFLRALRLNENPGISYVRALLPGEIAHDSPHDASRGGPPRGSYVETFEGEEIRCKHILCTFADEPDWGMDQDLFENEEYAYGSVPFGFASGLSSQAPFHSAFFCENPLLLRILPGLGRSFMEERIRLFLALASLAFQKKIHYWGWRFTAWAMHYLQDLAQPYHAKSLPAGMLFLAGHFARDPIPRGFQHRNHNLLKNRHLLFESSVHFLMNESFKNGRDHRFLKALPGNGVPIESTLREFMHSTGRIAAGMAQRADQSIVRLMNDPRLHDRSYCIERDPDHRIQDKLGRAKIERSDSVSEFEDIVCTVLRQAGIATRYVVTRIGRFCAQ